MKFIDFEVFIKDWLCVVIDPLNESEEVIVNDPARLEHLYHENTKEIWCGHNIKKYDQFIFKGILCGFNPKEINDWIIVEEKDGHQFSKLFNEYPMIIYDTMVTPKSLKQLEGFMGSNIKESKIDFTINRKLTQEEIEETIKYCRHDVEQCIEVFVKQINEFNAAMGLIQMFPEALNIYDLKLTKAQMSAKILECSRRERDDEFDLFILDCINIHKYASAKDFFLNPENHWYKKGTKKCEYKMIIAGLEHTLGWGGIHAGKEKYHNSGVGRQMWHIDVAAFYPRLMIFHNLLTRNTKNPDKFRQIYDRRIQLKKEGKKKEQAPLKIVINGVYGVCKDKYSAAYDPRNANLICINGQLMLIDLIEHLEKIDGFELIQSNTDGLIISLPDTDEAFYQMDDICWEWETRCNMELEFDRIKFIHQKDVNNYVFQFADKRNKDTGELEIERKGAYVKELSDLDYDLPIVNKALVDFFIKGIPIEHTITNCNDLHQFQMVKKISSKFENLKHSSKILPEKCVRVFASTDMSDGGLYWKSARTGSYGKVTNTPEHCFIENGNVVGVIPPKKLDKQWYVDIAKKRLNDYGVMT